MAKKEKIEQTEQKPDNGKQNFVLDEETKKALIKASGDSDLEKDEPTKFTLLEGLQDRDKADYYTEYKDKNEIEQVNRLQTWARLFPVVFGDTKGVREIQAIVFEHVKDNMVNRASLKRKRESALVYAVKQDTGLIQADKQIASFLGGRK